MLTQSETRQDSHPAIDSLTGHPDIRAPLVIGFVNNAPPAGLRGPRRQFQSLLEQAARTGADGAQHGRAIRLRCFAQHASDAADGGVPHEPIDALWSARLDGLIVTGAEPRAAAMTDEPAWPLLARLADWAAQNTISTIWSCLAAHAVVYRQHGLHRLRLPAKLAGVYAGECATPHDLTANLPPAWSVPHSRCNTLDEGELVAAGYTVLSRIGTSGGAMVDMFVRQDESLFVFQQGHPEYRPETLLREYRRDVRRFLANERDTYPALPEACFDADMANAMTTLRDLATQRRGPDLLAAFDTAAGFTLRDDWRDSAIAIYAAWLALIQDRKSAATDQRWTAAA